MTISSPVGNPEPGSGDYLSGNFESSGSSDSPISQPNMSGRSIKVWESVSKILSLQAGLSEEEDIKSRNLSDLSAKKRTDMVAKKQKGDQTGQETFRADLTVMEVRESHISPANKRGYQIRRPHCVATRKTAQDITELARLESTATSSCHVHFMSISGLPDILGSQVLTPGEQRAFVQYVTSEFPKLENNYRGNKKKTTDHLLSTCSEFNRLLELNDKQKLTSVSTGLLLFYLVCAIKQICASLSGKDDNAHRLSDNNRFASKDLNLWECTNYQAVINVLMNGKDSIKKDSEVAGQKLADQKLADQKLYWALSFMELALFNSCCHDSIIKFGAREGVNYALLESRVISLFDLLEDSFISLVFNKSFWNAGSGTEILSAFIETFHYSDINCHSPFIFRFKKVFDALYKSMPEENVSDEIKKRMELYASIIVIQGGELDENCSIYKNVVRELFFFRKFASAAVIYYSGFNFGAPASDPLIAIYALDILMNNYSLEDKRNDRYFLDKEYAPAFLTKELRKAVRKNRLYNTRSRFFTDGLIAMDCLLQKKPENMIARARAYINNEKRAEMRYGLFPVRYPDYLMGIVHWAQNDMGNARQYFEKSAKPESSIFLGVLHEKQGNFVEAFQCYEQAWHRGLKSAAVNIIKLIPRLRGNRSGLPLTELYQTYIEAAEQHYKQLGLDDTEDLDYHNNIFQWETFRQEEPGSSAECSEVAVGVSQPPESEFKDINPLPLNEAEPQTASDFPETGMSDESAGSLTDEASTGKKLSKSELAARAMAIREHTNKTDYQQAINCIELAGRETTDLQQQVLLGQADLWRIFHQTHYLQNYRSVSDDQAIKNKGLEILSYNVLSDLWQSGRMAEIAKRQRILPGKVINMSDLLIQLCYLTKGCLEELHRADAIQSSDWLQSPLKVVELLQQRWQSDRACDFLSATLLSTLGHITQLMFRKQKDLLVAKGGAIAAPGDFYQAANRMNPLRKKRNELSVRIKSKTLLGSRYK